MKTIAEYQKVKLHRTGDRPLAFLGRKVASASTEGVESTRWSKVQVYETDNGRFVVRIAYITKWEGERDRSFAYVFGTREDAVSYVCSHAAVLADEIADELGVKKQV